MGKIDVSIILVNYNGLNVLRDCLDSIFRHSSGFTFEVIVVDNDSKDGSVEYLSQRKDIVFIKAGENLGFGRGNNLGFQHSHGEYLFLLNTDTILRNNAIKIFLDRYNSFADVGCIGCYLKGLDGNVCMSYGRFTSVSYEFRKGIMTYFKRLGILSNQGVDLIDGREVDYVIGADIFMNRNIASQLGLFDSRYFMYGEESDMQRRYRKNGYRHYVVCGPDIMHLEGAGKGVSMKRKILAEAGKFLYIRIWDGNFKYVIFRLGYFFLKFPIIFDMKYTIREKMHYLLWLASGRR